MDASLRAWWRARPDTIPGFDPGECADRWTVETRAILHTARYYGARGPNATARRLAVEYVGECPDRVVQPPPPVSERDRFGF
ncbi:hypothetical protein [Micromonospora sp. NPDC049645]|uniref:hypothetical protein n=1 Tax=Micromonospora sp. NPDC049645 TaxID=3155508 RepID=UPI003417C904